ncbi:Thioredoxin domain-containing protein 5 [Nymphon striatum]|nr:Thioredoxin domain-containing protein 5 [Nymphon striatum]
MHNNEKKETFGNKKTYSLSAVNSESADGPVPVIYTSSENLESKLEENHHFVKFYAPWCGHCKRLAPTWEDLAAKFNVESEDENRVIIAKVDCTTEASICSSNGVNAYPTLKFFRKGSKEGVKYRGARDLKALSDFVHSTLESHIDNETSQSKDQPASSVPSSDKSLTELTDDTFEKFVEHGKHFIKFYAPWCGYCQKLAPTWESLADSLKYDPTMHISKVDCTENRNVCKEMEVKGYPTLIWISNGKKVEKYAGGRSHEDLKEYVSKMLSTAGEATDDKAPEVKEPASGTVELTGKNFDSAMQKEVAFVKFFAPWCGHCKALAPTWTQLATKFVSSPNIMIAKVDCTVEQDICKRNKVQGYPTLMIYSKGEFIREYEGNRSLEDLHAFVESNMPKHDEL